MILVTSVQEFLDRPPGLVRIPGSSARIIQKWLAIIHNTPLPPNPEPKQPASPRSATDGSGSVSELDPASASSRDRLSTFSSLATSSMADIISPSSDYSSLPPRSAIPGTAHSSISPFWFNATSEDMPVQGFENHSQVTMTALVREHSMMRQYEVAPPLPGTPPLPSPHPFAAASFSRSDSDPSNSPDSDQRPYTAPTQGLSQFLFSPPPTAPARIRRQLPIPPIPTPNCVPPPSSPLPSGSHSPPPTSYHGHSSSFSHPHRTTSSSATTDGHVGGVSLERPISPSQSVSSGSASGSASGSGGSRLHYVRRSLHARGVPPAMPPPPGSAPFPPKLTQELQYARANRSASADASAGGSAMYQEVRTYTQRPLRVQNGLTETVGSPPSTSAGYVDAGRVGIQMLASSSNEHAQASGLVTQMEDFTIADSHTSLHHAYSYPRSHHTLISPRRETTMPANYITSSLSNNNDTSMMEMDERASMYDVPPPAYDAIDFSAPMHSVVLAASTQGRPRNPPPRTLPSPPPQTQPLPR